MTHKNKNERVLSVAEPAQARLTALTTRWSGRSTTRRIRRTR